MKKIKENIWCIIGSIFILVMFIWMFIYGTSKEVWYVGMHDSLHEGENCHCYERFMEKE